MSGKIIIGGYDDAVGVLVISIDGGEFAAEYRDIPDRVPLPRREAADILRRMADCLEEAAL